MNIKNINYSIEYFYGKIFDNIFLVKNKYSEIYENKFADVYKRIDNDVIFNLISDKLKRPVKEIINITRSKNFLKKIFLKKLEKNIDTQILLDSIFDNHDIMVIKNFIKKNCRCDERTLALATLNDRIDILELFEPQLKNNLFIYWKNNIQTYRYLTSKNLRINIESLLRFIPEYKNDDYLIMSEIFEYITPTNKCLELAFMNGNPELIRLILNNMENNIPKEYFDYLFLSRHPKIGLLIDELMEKKFFFINKNMIYSAVLSGIIDNVKIIERIFPNIHEENEMDYPINGKHIRTLLSDDLIYHKNNKIYLSHVMEYAVNSGSLSMVEYVYGLGYGLSLSNLKTAIMSGKIEIIEFILNKNILNKELPSYFYIYFDSSFFLKNKTDIFDILNEHDYCIKYPNNTEDYKKMNIQSEINKIEKIIDENNIYDPDYLLNNHQLIFSDHGQTIPFHGHLRKLIEESNVYRFLEIYDNDKKYMTNMLYIYGTIKFICQCNKFIKISIPSTKIILDFISICDIPKLCFIFNNNDFDTTTIKKYINYATETNPIVATIIQKKYNVEATDISLFISGNIINKKITIENSQIKEFIKYSYHKMNIDNFREHIEKHTNIIFNSELLEWCIHNEIFC